MSLVCSRKTSPASQKGVNTALTCQDRPWAPWGAAPTPPTHGAHRSGCPPRRVLAQRRRDEPSGRSSTCSPGCAAHPRRSAGRGRVPTSAAAGGTHGHPRPPSPPACRCSHPADLADAGKAGLAQPLLPLHRRLTEEEVDLVIIGVLALRHPKNGHELGLWGQRGAASSASASSAPRGPWGTCRGPRRAQPLPCPAAGQRQSEGGTPPGTRGLRGAQAPLKSPSAGSRGQGAAEPGRLVAPMPPGSSNAAPGCRRPHCPPAARH